MEVIQHYGLIDEAGAVISCRSVPVDDEGPPPDVFEGKDFRLLPAKPEWGAQPSPLHKLRWVDYGIEPEWMLPALEEAKAAAIARTYPDVDGVYRDAVGNRTTEYANAEAAAREYMAAEVKPEIVSGYLTGHARSNPTGEVQSNEWACQQIIERADAFRWAELQMRNVRFDRQADMRAATTDADLVAAVAAWEGFIVWLRATLGL
jgi:hypothetical protein